MKTVGFIVEGYGDDMHLYRVLGKRYHTVVTNGTRFTNRTRMDIDAVMAIVDTLYILTDPDDAGDVIANMILKEYPNLERIHLDAEHCKYLDRKYRQFTGVEYARPEYLKKVLSKYL